MKRLYTSIAMTAVALLTLSCTGGKQGDIDADYVLISTCYGDIKVLLYDDTPIHKQNFLKLADSGMLDSLMFHRVIRDFMIQGGDPDSRDAAKGQALGQGEIGSPLEPEILYPKHLHKRGALAAARKPDNVNPKRMSSGSQFYIVQGAVLDEHLLDIIESKMNTRVKTEILRKEQAKHKDELERLEAEGKQEELMNLKLEIMAAVSEQADEHPYVIPEEVREVYMTVGGTPHLDGDYTVFGEVVEGMDVVDSIAAVAVDMRNRPSTDIRFSAKVIR